jgi:hypothetical protein
MKNPLIACALAGIALAAFADAPSGPPTMKFTSIPVMEKVGAGEHKIYPYRIEDQVVVIVVDPIACGQKPVNPRFEIKGRSLILRYDLTRGLASTTSTACTAHSTFELSAMPDTDLQVEFAGGPEAFHVAQMTRCPKAKPVTDIWDCMVPAP